MVLRVVGVMMVLLVAAATKPVSRGNLSGEDPQSLLKLWSLDHAFSARFSDLRIDAYALASMTKETIDYDFPSAAAVHRASLWYRLQELQHTKRRKLAKIDLADLTKDYAGVRITKDKSVLTMGAKQDIAMYRKDGVLKIVADGVDFVTEQMTQNGAAIGTGKQTKLTLGAQSTLRVRPDAKAKCYTWPNLGQAAKLPAALKDKLVIHIDPSRGLVKGKLPNYANGKVAGKNQAAWLAKFQLSFKNKATLMSATGKGGVKLSGTVIGGPKCANGKNCAYAQFDDIWQPDTYNSKGEWSVGVWFKWNPNLKPFSSAGDPVPILGNNQNTPFLGMSFTSKSWSHLRQYNGGAQSVHWKSPKGTNYADGQWHLAVITSSKGELDLELFVDGISLGEKKHSGKQGHTHGNGALRYLGRDYASYMDGRIGPMFAWHRRLKAADVKQLMSMAGKPGSAAGTIRWSPTSRVPEACDGRNWRALGADTAMIDAAVKKALAAGGCSCAGGGGKPKPKPKDSSLMVELSGNMQLGKNGKLVWTDKSGNGNDCKAVGGASALGGGGMTVRSSSKKRDGCQIAGSSKINVGSMATWEFVVRLRSFGGNANGRWLEVSNGCGSTAWNFCPGNANGQLRFWSNKAGVVLSPKNTLVLGDWMHIVIVKNAKSKKLLMYKNGKKVADLSSPGPFEPGEKYPRDVMFSSCYDRWNDADLRSLRIYKSMKHDNDIAKMYQAAKPTLRNLPGWVKKAGFRCGKGKWFKDQKKDKSKTYATNVVTCAALCKKHKAAGCVAFDLHNKVTSGYCNLYRKDQCSSFGGNSAYDAYTWSSGKYYYTPLGKACPKADLIQSQAECVQAYSELKRLGISPSGKGLNKKNRQGTHGSDLHVTSKGWNGYPDKCSFHNVNGGGLHFAKNHPPNHSKSDVFAICTRKS